MEINTKQKKGLKRDVIDKFYTKPEIVATCCDQFHKYIQLNTNDIIIEPSAGNGAFISAIKDLAKETGCQTKFYDIKPEHPEITEQNFLELDLSALKSASNNGSAICTGKRIFVIGNPPFGRQSTSAIKFIKHSATVADGIAFILPKSFKKDSMKKYFPLQYHCLLEYDLPDKAFTVDSQEYDVPCVFQIWQRQLKPRNKPIREESDGFEFTNKDNAPTFAIRRVGVYAGRVSSDVDDKNVQSHYFIKVNTENVLLGELEKKLNAIQFETGNTVGPRSISKQEFIAKYNPIFKKLIGDS